MGAGASALVPAKLDKATARDLAGARFDENKFDAAAGEDGFVSREVFLEAAAKICMEDLHASRLMAEEIGAAVDGAEVDDEEEADAVVLQHTVQRNQEAIDSNAAVIEGLRKALAEQSAAGRASMS